MNPIQHHNIRKVLSLLRDALFIGSLIGVAIIGWVMGASQSLGWAIFGAFMGLVLVYYVWGVLLGKIKL
jgi:hypothetical protein